MEDQGKRLLLAVAIAFGIMLVWTMLFPPEQPEKKPEVSETRGGDGGVEQPGDSPGKAGAGKVAGESGDQTAAPSGDKKPVVEAPTEQVRGEATTVVFGKFDQFKAVLSTHSGALVSWELLGEKYEDREGGLGKQIDLVPTGNDERFPTDDLEVDPYALVVGFDEASDLQIPPQSEWTIERQTDTEVDFGWSSKDLRVVKKYKFIPEDYLLSLTVEVEKISAGEVKQSLVVSTFQYQDPSASTGGRWTRVDRSWRTGCYVGGELETNSASYLERGLKNYRGNVRWAGFTHSYFLAAYSPKPEVDNQLTCLASVVSKDHRGLMRMDLVFGPPKKLGQGDIYGRTVTAYLGPKYLGKLDSISDTVGYTTSFEESIDLGWFAVISRPLLWLLQWLQSIVVNWGVAIILLTVIVKAATLYWTNKSMKSMRAMAILKPEVEKIQKKYPDDKQRQQVEIMGLYKTHKVSPLSGCLPMLLQMPIWFALYRTLMVAAELYQAPFIPGWINDLTAPDPIYVLPIALTGMMFLQAKLSPSVADSTQQKVMMYGMPIMFGVFSFFFPAGLTLYIFTNTCLTAVHHLWMKRSEEAAAPPAAVKGNDEVVDVESTEVVGASGGDEASAQPAGNRPNKGTKSRKRAGQRKRGNKRKRSA